MEHVASATARPHAHTEGGNTVPLIIMVLAFQRRIVSGLTAGGVKA